MAWVNYREIRERFGHIDAEFVRASSAFDRDAGSVEVVVRLYPWWEHPKYREAIAAGERWGFQNYEEGKREVTVRAIRARTARLSPRTDVIDWDFTESHPLLWEFEQLVTIYVNASFDPAVAVTALLERKLPYVGRHDLARFLGTSRRLAPYALAVPDSLAGPVLDVLAGLHVPVVASRPPKLPTPAVVFLLDDSDYVIAEDFEVDLPEFEHDPTWFVPQP